MALTDADLVGRYGRRVEVFADACGRGVRSAADWKDEVVAVVVTERPVVLQVARVPGALEGQGHGPVLVRH